MEAVLLTKDGSLRIGPLDGTRLIRTSKDVFKEGYQLALSNVLENAGVATEEMLVDVYQVAYFGDSFEKICNRFAGKWSQKFLTQNQVVEFCLVYKRWLGLYSEPTVFICKKDENELIDENNPEDNLLVVYIDYDGHSLTAHFTSILECDVWFGKLLVRMVLPKIEV